MHRLLVTYTPANRSAQTCPVCVEDDRLSKEQRFKECDGDHTQAALDDDSVALSYDIVMQAAAELEAQGGADWFG